MVWTNAQYLCSPGKLPPESRGILLTDSQTILDGFDNLHHDFLDSDLEWIMSETNDHNEAGSIVEDTDDGNPDASDDLDPHHPPKELHD